jgi:dTDP-4-dehydrorhamnose reductase
MMKIFLAGSKGQLGRALLRQATDSFDILPMDLPELDIQDRNQLDTVFADFGPAMVINAAAYTNVDQAETEKELAFAINRDAVANLAALCHRMAIPLIHISTDFVFNGQKCSPYLENDPIDPVSVYGKSKAAGEKAIRSRLKTHIIIRTAWLYGVDGRNFVKTMLRLSQEKEIISVVADQCGCPTSAFDLAGAIWMLARQFANTGKLAWGTYHYCGRGQTTWHGFTQTILEMAAVHLPVKTTMVKPVTTAQYPTPAARPAYSVLDCNLIAQRFGIKPPPWQESLLRVIAELMDKDRQGAFSR